MAIGLTGALLRMAIRNLCFMRGPRNLNAWNYMDNLKSLKQEIAKLKAENWVLRDSALRTYDGLAQKAHKYDEALKIIKNFVDDWNSEPVPKDFYIEACKFLKDNK